MMKSIIFIAIFLGLVLFASAEAPIYTVTQPGPFTVTTSTTSDTVIRVRLPNMYEYEQMTLRTGTNVPSDVEMGGSWKIYGQFCAPVYELLTSWQADYNSLSYWCHGADCNDTIITLNGLCPNLHKFTCDFYITLPIRLERTIQFEIALTGPRYVEQALAPVGIANSLLSQTVDETQIKVFSVDASTVTIKSWNVVVTGNVAAQIGRYPASSQCSSYGPQFIGYGGMASFYDAPTSCNVNPATDNKGKLYITVSASSAQTFNLLAKFAVTPFSSQVQTVPKISLGQSYSGSVAAASVTYIDVDLLSISFPNKTQIKVCGAMGNPASGMLAFGIAQNRTAGQCAWPMGLHQWLEGGSACHFLDIDVTCESGNFPTVVRVEVISRANISVSFTLSAFSVSNYPTTVVTAGQEQIAQSSSGNLFKIDGSESWSSGYVELQFMNYQTMPNAGSNGYMTREDFCGTWFSNCLAAQGTSCTTSIPLCAFEGSSGALHYRTSSSTSGFTFTRKDLSEIVNGMVINNNDDLFAFRAPAGLAAPVKVIFDVEQVGVYNGKVAVYRAGEKCELNLNGADYTNSVNFHFGISQVSVTLNCETDILLIKHFSVVPKLTVTIEAITPLALDAAQIGASRSLAHPETPGYEWVKVQVPNGVSKVTLRLRETGCLRYPGDSACSTWVAKAGCKFDPIFTDCTSGDACIAVLEANSANLFNGAIWLRGLIIEEATSVSVEIVSTNVACTVPTAQSSPLCAAYITYPVYPLESYYRIPELSAGAEVFLAQAERLYPAEINEWTLCYGAIKQIACAEKHMACSLEASTGVWKTVPVLCKEWCETAIGYCPSVVRANISAFICSGLNSCSDSIAPAPQFVTPTLPQPVAPPANAPVNAPEAAPAVAEAPVQAPVAAPQNGQISSPSTNTQVTDSAAHNAVSAVAYLLVLLVTLLM